MFAADRADHLARLVEPSLERGATVVSDRYLHSSMAYQSLEIGLEAVFSLNASFRVPDLTVFVAVSVDTCLARIEARGGEREIFEERTRLERIDTAYRAVLSRLRTRGDPIVVVDGEQPIDVVAARIRDEVAALASR
jgi:dTMP kinase